MTRSLDESLAKIISEEEFGKLLQRQSQGLLRIWNFMRAEGADPTLKRFYSCLMEEARELKNFLDDFDARSNRTYAYVTELVLSLVSFSAIGYLVRHVLTRYPRYRLRDDRDQFIEYHKRAEALLDYSHSTLWTLFEAVQREAVDVLGLRPPKDRIDEASFTNPLPRMHLPHTVDDGLPETKGGSAAVVATSFLHFADEFDGLALPKESEPGAAREFLRRTCGEDSVRRWEARMHGVQRVYDTLVKGTSVEAEEPRMASLRGHVSMVLHHLELIRYATHFLDHLEEGIRHEPAAERLRGLVDGDELLGHLFGFGFEMALLYVSQGKEVASEILEKYTKVIECRLTVPEGLSLHARPASLIVGVVTEHGTPVSLHIGSASCDAGSMIQVMMTLGTHSTEREIRFRGDQRPLRDLELLFESRLGEDGLEKLPEPLAYLRS